MYTTGTTRKPNLQFVELVHQALQISVHHESAGAAYTREKRIILC
jgi:hypothetical protein